MDNSSTIVYFIIIGLNFTNDREAYFKNWKLTILTEWNYPMYHNRYEADLYFLDHHRRFIDGIVK
jgi:hypothetical protein